MTRTRLVLPSIRSTPPQRHLGVPLVTVALLGLMSIGGCKRQIEAVEELIDEGAELTNQRAEMLCECLLPRGEANIDEASDDPLFESQLACEQAYLLDRVEDPERECMKEAFAADRKTAKASREFLECAVSIGHEYFECIEEYWMTCDEFEAQAKLNGTHVAHEILSAEADCFTSSQAAYDWCPELTLDQVIAAKKCSGS